MAEQTYEKGVACIVMDEKDNVATLLKDSYKGETLVYFKTDQTFQLTLKQDIKFGHKVSISPIKKDEAVIKYGEIIGAATDEINPGDHVHVHNIDGIRGRGDKQKGILKNENN